MSSVTEPTPVTEPRRAALRPARPRVTLAVTCAATLLVLMNYTAPVTVLPQTAAGVGADLGGQTWILNGIALGLASLLLVAGSLADDYGRRRALIAGAVLSVVGSIGCAAATSTDVLVIARVVQGGASAALLTASLGMIGHAFPGGPARARATGLWGATLGAGIALGPLASSGLTEIWSWRAFYWAFAAASTVVALAAATALPESRADQPRPIDLAGVVTLGPGLAALLGAVTLGRTGWTRPSVLLLFAVAAVLLLAFVVAEAVGPRTMLDLGLFRRPLFLLSTGGALVTGLSVIGLMSFLPTILQHTLHQTPLLTAGWLGVWSGSSFVAALQARRLPIHPGHVLALGLLCAAAGDLVLLDFAVHWSAVRMAVGLVVAGIGSGLANAALARLAVGSVPADRASMGTGANNTARYIGSSVGVALVVAVVSAAAGPHADLAGGADAALLAAAAVSLAGALSAVLLRRASATA
jgi:MFS family permease